MNRILIFAGTTEGRRLAEFCAEHRIPADVSSATAYGASLLPDGIGVLSGRLNADEISIILRSNRYAKVIDATHPYAADITHTLRMVCTECGIPYCRLLREAEPIYGKSVSDLESMTALLNETDDAILSTLGSKSAAELTAISGFRVRLWLRILPSNEAVRNCIRLGYPQAHIIEAKGAFTTDDNIRHIKQSGAKILLTKESGKIGGYPEKVQAAMQTGIRLLTLSRPPETGFSFGEITAMLLENET